MKRSVRIDIFCESGEKQGLGHLYRSLKLAKLCQRVCGYIQPQSKSISQAESKLDSSPITHITLHNRGDFSLTAFDDVLRECGNCSPVITCKQEEWFIEQNLQSHYDIVIIDSYEATPHLYRTLQARSCAMICLDDMGRDCYPSHSIILRPTPLSYDETHTNSANLYESCELWCGLEYAIMPDKAWLDSASHHSPQLESKLQSKTNTKQVFVNFGGVDRGNITQDFFNALMAYVSNLDSSFANSSSLDSSAYGTLESSILIESSESRALSSPPNSSQTTPLSTLLSSCHFHIVLGGGYPHKFHTQLHTTAQKPKQQEQQKHSTPRFSIYHNLPPTAFLQLAKFCDYAISAGGGTSLELLFLQIPSIILQTASNQRAQIACLTESSAIVPSDSIESCITALADFIEADYKHDECRYGDGMQEDRSSLARVRAGMKKLDLGMRLEEKLTSLVYRVACMSRG